MYLVWAKHRKFCNECLELFSSPWEKQCKKCADSKEESWIGWKVARQLQEVFEKKLDTQVTHALG